MPPEPPDLLPHDIFRAYLTDRQRVTPEPPPDTEVVGTRWAQPNPYAKHVTPSKLLIRSDVCVGLEVELEGAIREIAPLMRSANWSVVNDGSLRNNGMELILKNPAVGSMFDHAMAEFEGWVIRRNLLDKEAEMCSSRASTHIHIDMRALGTEKVVAFLCLAVLLNPLWMSVMPENRRVTPFTKPISNDHLRMIAFMHRGDISPSRIALGRYCAVNLDALSKFGSVEFRMFPATLSARQIVFWTNALLSMYTYAEQNTLDITALLEQVSGESLDLLKEIVGAPLANTWFYTEDYHHNLMVGARNLQLVNIYMKEMPY